MGEDNETYYTLLDFYKVYRAYVRGKVISFILNDPNIEERKKQEAIKERKKKKWFFVR